MIFDEMPFQEEYEAGPTPFLRPVNSCPGLRGVSQSSMLDKYESILLRNALNSASSFRGTGHPLGIFKASGLTLFSLILTS
jgi:hypothetical protein